MAVYLHFGPEYEREPSDYQKLVLARLFEMGADIIFGSHPHVVQPAEVRKIIREG